MKFIIHTDGGARGNPGPAAIGVVIEKIKNQISKIKNEEKELLIEYGKRIGETTNNVAEYLAVVNALQEIKNQKSKIKNEDEKSKIEIQFYLDSNLVVNQLNGLFKVKDPVLRELLIQIRMLEQEVGGAVTYAYVTREQNRRADFLVNQALGP